MRVVGPCCSVVSCDSRDPVQCDHGQGGDQAGDQCSGRTLQFLAEMQQLGLQPMGSLAGGFNAGGWVLRSFDEMRQQGLQPGVVIYGAVLSASDRALLLFGELRQQGSSPM